MQIYRPAVGLNMAFSVSGCPVIRQHMTCHESTGMAPSLSAALPNGLSHGFVSFFVFSCPSLFSFFLNVPLSSFFFHAAPAAQKLPLLSLASSNEIQKRQQSGQRTGRVGGGGHRICSR